MRKYLGMISMVVAVAALTAFGTANFALTQIQRMSASYWTPATNPDSLTGAGAGGKFHYAIVGTTDTLKAGDVVYWADTNKVKKSATLANYNEIAGVVIGGAITGSAKAYNASGDVGTNVAAPGQVVLICKTCRVWMRSSNNAAWLSGRRVLPSDSIAGRLDTALTAAVIDSLHRTVGRTVSAASALGVVLVDVNIK
jgi:hypothetical protein